MGRQENQPIISGIPKYKAVNVADQLTTGGAN